MKLLAAMVLVFVILLGCLFVWIGIGSTPPEQEELEERFFESRAEYEQLRSMFEEDQLVTVGDYGEQYARRAFAWTTASEVVVSERRARSYQDHMNELDTARIDLQEDGSVSIYLAGWGFASDGWRISLVSNPNEPVPLLTTLDGFSKTDKDWEVAYSHIDGAWYFRIIW